MIEEARHYLRVVLDGEVPTLEELVRALDALAMAYHAVDPDAFFDTDVMPPDRRHGLRETIAARFPSFGYYAVANPLLVIDEKPGVGDAIDDLEDIAADLEGVVWRWENTDPEDAAWSYRFDYETHWGKHLHELRAYLHAKMFYGD